VNFTILRHLETVLAQEPAVLQPLIEQFPTQINREIISEIREFYPTTGISRKSYGKRPFLTACLVERRPRSVLTDKFAGEEDGDVDEIGSRVRYGEAFWRGHYEAWQQSALNQREYCEAHGIPLKAFGNWRAKFKAEPQLPKLLYRRRGLSHTLSHRLSHRLVI
jgi:hypothetical protein